MRYCGEVEANVVAVAESEEGAAGELSAIVGDDAVGDAESVDDVQKELDGPLCSDRGDWFCFNPLCELVDGDEKVRVAPGRLLERTNHVQTSDGEGPRDRDGLESLSRQVCLPGEVLASLTGAHDVLGI